MQFPDVPSESKSELNRAARLLCSDTEYIGGVEHARQLVARWRACHLKPLQAFADDLNARLVRLGMKAVVARRLKRLFRIRDKLRTLDTMELTQMQDIGALRAVVPTLADVRRLKQDYEENPPPCGTEIIKARKDYVATAKDNGYRSLHIVFQFVDIPPSKYNGIRIELQIRTQLQHEWASAVEITGLVSGKQLKYDEGDPAWADFFALAAEALARRDGAPRSQQFSDYSDEDMIRELRGVNTEVGAIEKIRSGAWPTIRDHAHFDSINASEDEMVLLSLNLKSGLLSATSMGRTVTIMLWLPTRMLSKNRTSKLIQPPWCSFVSTLATRWNKRTRRFS